MDPDSRPAKSKLVIAACVLGFVVGVVVLGYQGRELMIGSQYDDLPEAVVGDLESQRARLDGLKELVDRHPFSRVAFVADRERHDLQLRVDLLAGETSERQIAEENEAIDRQHQAESLRLEGLRSLAGEDLEAAAESFRGSLAVASPDWEERADLERQVAKIEEVIGQ